MQIKFYRAASGRSPVEEFISSLSLDVQAEFADALAVLGAGENLAMPLSRNLSSIHKGLHELRLKDRAGIYRIFYFIKSKDGIYFLHAFKKKSQELPRQEIDLAIKRIREI